MRPVFVFMGLMSIPFIITLILTATPPEQQSEKKITSGLFRMKFGGAVCGEYLETPCGITLRKCADEREYHCMQDVAMELDK